MVFLGLEQPVAYGREQVFDPTTAQMVLNANRDYINAVYNDYQQAMANMKEFNKEYGNFLSPFAKDMERYNQIVGGIQNGINDLYNRGIDPLRSSEGRAFVTRMINSVNPAELAAMKSNAKLGYAYLDAMQALRKAGKYSQAQEDFDIAFNGETAFNDFATGNGSGGFNTWGRTSPIEATTLRDLTYDSYKGRTARDATIEDFKNDPRLKNYKYDPRYQYSVYLDSDLMKAAPGASAALAGDPRAAFFRDQARQKVIASGKEPTAEAVEAQFQRDIADANDWALIGPIKKADDFAKINLEHTNRMAEIREAGKYKGGGSGSNNGGNDRYSPTMNMVVDSEGKLRGQLSHFISNDTNKALESKEKLTVEMLNRISKNPRAYSDDVKRHWISEYNNLAKNRETAGIEGVAREINKIKEQGKYFTDTPENINNILRDLSSTATQSTVTGLLRELGGHAGSNGGTHVDRQRLCGVGTVMQDILTRGLLNDGNNRTIKKALNRFNNNSDLGKYNVSWTAGTWDVRNETDDGGWWNHNNDELYATGNVVSGANYYYIEVANDPTDYDESCWFKVERDVQNGGGINPTISSITEYIDDSYTHGFSHTNIIGNPQSVVQGYNK